MKRKPQLLGLGMALVLLSACQLRCGGPPTGPGHTGGLAPMAVQGAEVWTVEDRHYKVASTFYLALPEGLQYTIDYELPPSVDVPRDDPGALAIAFPLMAHAFRTGAYQRTSITKVGSASVLPTRIGVALYRAEGPFRRGYATALSVEQVRQRLASQGTPGSPAAVPAPRQ